MAVRHKFPYIGRQAENSREYSGYSEKKFNVFCAVRLKQRKIFSVLQMIAAAPAGGGWRGAFINKDSA